MKAVKFLSNIASYTAMIIVGAIMMLTVTDVFMRYIFIRPITGSTELIEFMMVLLIVGIMPAAMENRHVRVDILMERLTPKGQALFDAISLILGSFLIAIMGWRAIISGIFMIDNDVRSPTLDIPVFPFYLIVAIGFIILFISMIAIIIRKIIEVIKT